MRKRRWQGELQANKVPLELSLVLKEVPMERST
ncbi:MAG: hypothetical protein ACI9SE_002665, partial [Neolewinella sp.]